MTPYKFFQRSILGLFFLVPAGLLMPLSAFAQTERLGTVSYTPVKGWKKTVKGNVVSFSELNETAGTFCIITLYGETRGTGNAQSDFKREWNNLAVKALGAEADPKTETEMADGWTMTAGGSAVEFQGTKAVAFLSVLSGQGTTVSILGVFNDESYLAKLVAFNSGIEMDKTVAKVPVIQDDEPSEPATTVTAAAAMHVAALVKEFENNEVRANQQWIGKRVRVYGTVNTIEIARNGNIEMTFKSSISTYNMGKAFFNKSQSSRVSALNSHEQATIECTVKGMGGGFDNSKAYLLLENCIVP